MRNILTLLSIVLLILFMGCSDSVPVNVDIGEIGAVDDVLSVKALTGDGKVHLQWQLPSDAIGVSIRRSETDFPFSVTSGDEIYAGSDSEFIDEDVYIGRRYYYLIVTIDKNLNFAGGVRKSSSVIEYGKISHFSPSISFNDFAIDGDSIYSAGYIGDGMSSVEMLIEKKNKDSGELVPLFNSNGIIRISPSGSDDRISSLAVDNEYIYTGSSVGGSSNSQWRLEKRRKDTGALDILFGSNGIVQDNYSSNLDRIASLVIDNDYIYIGGCDSVPGIGNTQWRIEKRRKDNGSLITAFGTGGVIQVNPSNVPDELTSLAIDNDYIYIGGYDGVLGYQQWRLEKRRKDNGALVAAFGVGGVIQNNPSSYSDGINTLVLDSDYIYAGGYDSLPGSSDFQFRIEKRRKDTGALVAAFSTSGVIQNNPSLLYDQIYSLQVDNNYIYAAGRINQNTYVAKYSKNDGSLISSFGVNGELNISAFSGYSQANKLLLNGSYLYICGYGYSSDMAVGFIMIVDSTTGIELTGPLIEKE